jgi:hypothetical protein
MPESLELKTFVSRGQVRYCCPACGFDSYSVEAVTHHHLHSHRGDGSTGMGPTLFDANGNTLNDNYTIETSDEELRAVFSRFTRR